MSGTSSSTPSGSRAVVARGLAGVREALDELRHPSARPSAPRPARADVRDVVLSALTTQPGTGYDVVRRLEERGTAPAPGAGAVYPTLQLLADEGLVTAADTDGPKIWTLTATGHAAATAPRPVEAPTAQRGVAHRGGIARSGAQLAQAAALAAQSATPDQVGEIVAVLDDARRRILSVLSRG